MENNNNHTHNTKLYPDAVMLDLGDALCVNESELKAIDPVVETLFTRFQVSHLALEARLYTRLDRQVSLPPLRTSRESSRKRLVHALGGIWDGLATVEASWSNPRPKDEVQALRSSLFRYGKPNDQRPGSFKLIEMATTVNGFLAGDSPLARAWPPAEVEELRTALVEYTTAIRSLRTGVVAKTVSVGDLNRDRSQWMVDFCCLRDTTLTITGARGEAGRWKPLFTDSRPGRARKEAKEDTGPPVTTPPPEEVAADPQGG